MFSLSNFFFCASKKKLNIKRLLFLVFIIFFLSPPFSAISNGFGFIIDCTYTPFPYDTFIYGVGGQFSYKLYSSRVELTSAPIGYFVIQPRENTTADGYFEVYIEDERVDLYSSSDMEASNLIGKKYEYPENSSSKFILYFHCDFDIDTDIMLKQWHGDREVITKPTPWVMVTQCPNCQQLLKVFAKSHNEVQRKRSQVRNYTTSEEIIFDYPGGTGDVTVAETGFAGSNCGWYAEAKQSWITLTSEAVGPGGLIFTFKIDTNNEDRDRTGSIEILLEDGERLDEVTIVQFDKRLNSIEINYPSNVLSEGGIRYISETVAVDSCRRTEANFSITAYFDGGYSFELNRDYNLKWYVDSPDYAEIDVSGKLSANNVNQDSIVKITAIYYYKNYGIQKTTPREASAYLTIKDITTLSSLKLSGNGSADENLSVNRYSVEASFSNLPFPIDVTNNVVWAVNLNSAFVSQDGLLTVYSVDEKTLIDIKASYTYRVTKEANFPVEINDLTQLDRVSIIGKRNVKSNERAEYIVLGHFNNEPDKDITDQLISYSLDSNNYTYADLLLESKKLVLATKTVENPKDITIQVRYNFKGKEVRALYPVYIGNSPWEIAISSEYITVVEGDQLSLKAMQTSGNQSPIDVTDSAAWSLEEGSNDYALIDNGNLSANFVQGGDKQIVIKACLNYQGFTKCDNINIRIIDLTQLYLDIRGPDTIVEGETANYYATAIWTNEDDEDISNICIWSTSAPEYVSISIDQENNRAILTSENVSSDEKVTITVRYSAHGKTASSSKVIDIQKISELSNLVITGSEEVNENTSNHKYEAKAIFDSGDGAIVTESCEWSISDSDLGTITNQGYLSADDLRLGDQTVMISASYNLLNTVKTAVFPVLIRDIPEAFNIKGNISFKESVDGNLVVIACMASDETCYTHADMYKVEWDNVGSESSQTYTSDIDFDKGTLVNLNHDNPYNDQLQMDINAIQGSWNVIHSSSNLQADWAKLDWISEEPEGTSIKTLVRSSDTQSNLTAREFVEIENSTDLQDIIGKYIEVQVSFNRSSEVNESPILYDITITEKLPISMAYKLVGSENEQYKIIAFIDIDKNDIKNNCEPIAVYPEIVSYENLYADFSLVVPATCPKSGLALDMNLSSNIPYDQDRVSNVGIEEKTSTTIEPGNYVDVGVVAQNVTNLDTFQFDIVFEPDKLEYVDASEKDNQGLIPSFLNINGGTTIGFMDRYVNDRITIANALVGKSCEEAPEGSGIIAFLRFKVIDTNGDKTLTIQNVSFQNDCDEKNEEIENLKGGIILGESDPELESDFNKDCIVNYLDLGIFANCWLKKSDEAGWSNCEMCNLDPTIDESLSLNIINYLDLGKFAGEWLRKCDAEDSK